MTLTETVYKVYCNWH